jgi:hypothetical protein
LGLPQVRDESHQHPDQHEQDGRRDRVATREGTARDQGDTEQDDHLESKHEHILTSNRSAAPRPALICWIRRVLSKHSARSASSSAFQLMKRALRSRGELAERRLWSTDIPGRPPSHVHGVEIVGASHRSSAIDH